MRKLVHYPFKRRNSQQYSDALRNANIYLIDGIPYHSFFYTTENRRSAYYLFPVMPLSPKFCGTKYVASKCYHKSLPLMFNEAYDLYEIEKEFRSVRSKFLDMSPKWEFVNTLDTENLIYTGMKSLVNIFTEGGKEVVLRDHSKVHINFDMEKLYNARIAFYKKVKESYPELYNKIINYITASDNFIPGNFFIKENISDKLDKINMSKVTENLSELQSYSYDKLITEKYITLRSMITNIIHLKSLKSKELLYDAVTGKEEFLNISVDLLNRWIDLFQSNQSLLSERDKFDAKVRRIYQVASIKGWTSEEVKIFMSDLGDFNKNHAIYTHYSDVVTTEKQFLVGFYDTSVPQDKVELLYSRLKSLDPMNPSLSKSLGYRQYNIDRVSEDKEKATVKEIRSRNDAEYNKLTDRVSARCQSASEARCHKRSFSETKDLDRLTKLDYAELTYFSNLAARYGLHYVYLGYVEFHDEIMIKFSLNALALDSFVKNMHYIYKRIEEYSPLMNKAQSLLLRKLFALYTSNVHKYLVEISNITSKNRLKVKIVKTIIFLQLCKGSYKFFDDKLRKDYLFARKVFASIILLKYRMGEDLGGYSLKEFSRAGFITKKAEVKAKWSISQINTYFSRNGEFKTDKTRREKYNGKYNDINKGLKLKSDSYKFNMEQYKEFLADSKVNPTERNFRKVNEYKTKLISLNKEITFLKNELTKLELTEFNLNKIHWHHSTKYTGKSTYDPKHNYILDHKLLLYFTNPTVISRMHGGN